MRIECGKTLFLASAVMAVALTAGCSGGGGSGDSGDGDRGDGVVSVDESKGQKEGTESSADAESESGRPQIRLDTSEVEELRMYQGYLRCLKDRGVEIGQAGSKAGDWADPESLWFPSMNVAKERPEVEKACLGKKPLQPPELDPKTNPDYMNDYREWIECDNRRGLKVEALPDGGGWNFKPGAVQPKNADQIDSECMREAFSGE